MNQKQKIIKTYKSGKTTKSFDEERSKYEFQRYKHKIEADFLKKALREIKKDKIKILDIGCGTGRMLAEVFSVGKDIEYIGLDTSKPMIKHLKKKAKKLGIEKKVKVKISGASKIPFKDNEFDIVFSYHLLWHIPKEEQEKIIGEMLRVCRKRGRIIFDILYKNFIWEKIKILIGKNKTQGIYKLSIGNIKEIIQDKDFKIEKLNDFPIKNNFKYNIFNVFNKIRKVLPRLFYHMIYFKVKK